MLHIHFFRLGELFILLLPENEKRAASNIRIPFSPLRSLLTFLGSSELVYYLIIKVLC